MICSPSALMDHWDDFDRVDNVDLGAAWRPDFDALKIVSQQVQLSTPASFSARQGAWETYVGGYNGGRLLTDNWEIIGQIATPVGTAATTNYSALGAGMFAAGPGAGMVLVYAVMLQGTANATAAMAIYTYSNSTIVSPGNATGASGQTVRGTTSTVRVANGDIVRFRRRKYSATQSQFDFLQNGTVRASWNDSGGVVPAGDPLRRQWFVQCEGNATTGTAQYSPSISNVRAWDRPY
ncbi:hypothetical protein ACPESR_25240 [Nocardia testacea]|uniref:hypothetical protein n=1 Tax=Nocardia testacea TaxID=248551 RepID=UPI003C2E52BA